MPRKSRNPPKTTQASTQAAAARLPIGATGALHWTTGTDGGGPPGGGVGGGGPGGKSPPWFGCLGGRAPRRGPAVACPCPESPSAPFASAFRGGAMASKGITWKRDCCLGVRWTSLSRLAMGTTGGTSLAGAGSADERGGGCGGTSPRRRPHRAQRDSSSAFSAPQYAQSICLQQPPG